jgi:hypothetical protein
MRDLLKYMLVFIVVSFAARSEESPVVGQALYERVIRMIDASLQMIDAQEQRFRAVYFGKIRDHTALRSTLTDRSILEKLQQNRAEVQKDRRELAESLKELHAQKLTLANFNNRAVNAAKNSIWYAWAGAIQDMELDQYKIEADARWEVILTRETFNAECAKLEAIKNPAQFKAAKEQVEAGLKAEEIARLETYRSRYTAALQRWNAHRSTLAGELREFQNYLLRRKYNEHYKTIDLAVRQYFELELEKKLTGRNSELDLALMGSLDDCDLHFVFEPSHGLTPEPELRKVDLNKLWVQDNTLAKTEAQHNRRLDTRTNGVGMSGLELHNAHEATIEKYELLKASIPVRAVELIRMQVRARDIVSQREAVAKAEKDARFELSTAADNVALANKILRLNVIKAPESAQIEVLDSKIQNIRAALKKEPNATLQENLERLSAERKAKQDLLENAVAPFRAATAAAEAERTQKQNALNAAMRNKGELNGKWREYSSLHDRIRDSLTGDRSLLTSMPYEFWSLNPETILGRVETLERRTGDLSLTAEDRAVLGKRLLEYSNSAKKAKKAVRDILTQGRDALTELDREYARRSTPEASQPRTQLKELNEQMSTRLALLEGKAGDPAFTRLAGDWNTVKILEQIEIVRAAMVLTENLNSVPMLDSMQLNFESGDARKRANAWALALQNEGLNQVGWGAAEIYLRNMNTVEPARRAIVGAWTAYTTVPLSAFPKHGSRVDDPEEVMRGDVSADEAEKAMFMLQGLYVVKQQNPEAR